MITIQHKNEAKTSAYPPLKRLDPHITRKNSFDDDDEEEIYNFKSKGVKLIPSHVNYRLSTKDGYALSFLKPSRAISSKRSTNQLAISPSLEKYTTMQSYNPVNEDRPRDKVSRSHFNNIRKKKMITTLDKFFHDHSNVNDSRQNQTIDGFGWRDQSSFLDPPIHFKSSQRERKTPQAHKISIANSINNQKRLATPLEKQQIKPVFPRPLLGFLIQKKEIILKRSDSKSELSQIRSSGLPSASLQMRERQLKMPQIETVASPKKTLMLPRAPDDRSPQYRNVEIMSAKGSQRMDAKYTLAPRPKNDIDAWSKLDSDEDFDDF